MIFQNKLDDKKSIIKADNSLTIFSLKNVFFFFYNDDIQNIDN